MAGVRNVINELKLQQENLQSQIEKVEVEIKDAEEENYKLEQTKLSLQHQETLLQQKIKKTTEQEKAKLDKILILKAQYSGVDESSESLTAKSKDAYEKQEKLLDELKEAQEQANKNDMMYEELKKRLVHMERNRDRMEQRATLKEAEAKRLEEGFKDANSQVEVLKSKDIENDTDLMDKVSELQKKLDEAVRSAETSERVGAAFGQSIENLKQQIAKQREENEKIKKEMEKMNEVLEIPEP
ncbi:Tropomyosin [Taenia solium]|eukprot:TsM_000651100 transcript=TsM_000651100 gene=TsM_000651100